MSSFPPHGGRGDESAPPPPPPADGTPGDQPVSGFAPYDPYAQATYEAPGPLPHAGAGIASFVLALLAGLLLVVFPLLAAFVVSKHPGLADLQPSSSPDAISPDLVPPLLLMVCPMCSSIALALLGLLLGIIGLVQSERRKVLAMLGTAGSGLVLLGFLALFLIGLLASA